MWHGSQIWFTSKVLAMGLAVMMLTGCAGSIEHWVVNTRVHQGDVALDHGNVRDAELAYRLALKVDPKDARARSGLVQASGALAQDLYSSGDFDDALTTLDEGLKVDPGNVRLAGLKSTIEDAKLKREIVISNYPTYKEAGATLQKSYEQLSTANKSILQSLKRFSYTYDTGDLTSAIKRSYALELDVARNTNRLINYRDLVSAGIPESAHTTTSSGAASLLPLP
jgi:tetratricopeptide (TPR) repeat protein